MLLSVIALVVDTVISGQIAGEEGVSAMNVMTPIVSMITFAGNVISAGVSFCYGVAMGKLDKKRADKLFGMSVLVSVASGLVLYAVMTACFDMYVDFLKPAPEVLSHARGYYSYFKYAMIIEPLLLVLNLMIYNDGDELISNISNVTNIAGKIILSLIFASSLKMGVAGVALGTLAKDIISFGVLLCHFFRKANSLHPRMYFGFKDLWEFFKYGFVDSSMFLMWGLLLFVLNKFVSATFGGQYLPVLSMAISLVELTALFDGIAQAMLPLVGVYYNEGNYPAVRKVMGSATRMSIIEGIIFSVVVFIFAKYMPGMFGINDPLIVGECVNVVRIISLTLVFSSLLYLYETYYMAQGKNMIAVLSSCARNLVFVIVIAIPLAEVMGLNGVWVGFALAQVLTLVFCAWLMCAKYGRKNFPMFLDDKGLVADFDVLLTSENVMKTRDLAEKFMREHNIPSDVINRIMLLIEETGMMIIEHNEGKKVLAEYTIELYEKDQARVIVRDNGEIFDITNDDVDITSLRSYFLAGLMYIEKYKKNITTTSFNRNIFRVYSKQ